MVRCIQALNYRCLRDVDVRLDGNFHILVGPNASGKSKRCSTSSGSSPT